LNLFIVLFL